MIHWVGPILSLIAVVLLICTWVSMRQTAAALKRALQQAKAVNAMIDEARRNRP
jgi:type II secretory pathway pseudopilin PulG